MPAIIASMFSGLMSGFITPLFTYLNKKQDVTLDGFKAASTQDQATYQAWVNYQIQVQQLKIQSNNWWGAKLAYLIVAISAAIHIAAINLDSTFHFHWAISKLPMPYDQYEAYLVGSLFVTTLAAGPVSAVTAWLHRK